MQGLVAEALKSGLVAEALSFGPMVLLRAILPHQQDEGTHVVQKRMLGAEQLS